MAAPRSFHALALIPELLTSVRVEAAVQRMGGSVRVVETESEFVATLGDANPAIAILDLNAGSLNLTDLSGACARLDITLIAFGRHVDAGVLRAARQAGIGLVIPRGKFLEDMPGIIGGVLGRAAALP